MTEVSKFNTASVLTANMTQAAVFRRGKANVQAVKLKEIFAGLGINVTQDA